MDTALIVRLSNVADAFKTPGKLRGKTPRTARKRNPLETRAVSDYASLNHKQLLIVVAAADGHFRPQSRECP